MHIVIINVRLGQDVKVLWAMNHDECHIIATHFLLFPTGVSSVVS
jgi:hypothetical protein